MEKSNYKRKFFNEGVTREASPDPPSKPEEEQGGILAVNNNKKNDSSCEDSQHQQYYGCSGDYGSLASAPSFLQDPPKRQRLSDHKISLCSVYRGLIVQHEDAAPPQSSSAFHSFSHLHSQYSFAAGRRGELLLQQEEDDEETSRLMIRRSRQEGGGAGTAMQEHHCHHHLRENQQQQPGREEVVRSSSAPFLARRPLDKISSSTAAGGRAPPSSFKNATCSSLPSSSSAPHLGGGCGGLSPPSFFSCSWPSTFGCPPRPHSTSFFQEGDSLLPWQQQEGPVKEELPPSSSSAVTVLPLTSRGCEEEGSTTGMTILRRGGGAAGEPGGPGQTTQHQQQEEEDDEEFQMIIQALIQSSQQVSSDAVVASATSTFSIGRAEQQEGADDHHAPSLSEKTESFSSRRTSRMIVEPRLLRLDGHHSSSDVCPQEQTRQTNKNDPIAGSFPASSPAAYCCSSDLRADLRQQAPVARNEAFLQGVTKALSPSTRSSSITIPDVLPATWVPNGQLFDNIASSLSPPQETHPSTMNEVGKNNNKSGDSSSWTIEEQLGAFIRRQFLFPNLSVESDNSASLRPHGGQDHEAAALRSILVDTQVGRYPSDFQTNQSPPLTPQQEQEVGAITASTYNGETTKGSAGSWRAISSYPMLANPNLSPHQPIRCSSMMAATTPRSLATDEDSDWLSEFFCFVRSELVEVFQANESIAASKKNVEVGQVGIRCRFCASKPKQTRGGTPRRAASFPSSISRLYQSLTMMLRDHFDKCTDVPDHLRIRFSVLKGASLPGAPNSKHFWIESAKKLGLMDTPGNKGIRLHENSCGNAQERNPPAVLGAQGGILLNPQQIDETSVRNALAVATLNANEVERQPEREEASTELARIDTTASSTVVKCFGHRMVISEYLCCLMEEAQLVFLSEEDRAGSRGGLDLGSAGFGCKHCSAASRGGVSRFFPCRKRTVLAHIEKFSSHIQRCTLCPSSIKARIRQLSKIRSEDESEKSFFASFLWCRLKEVKDEGNGGLSLVVRWGGH